MGKRKQYTVKEKIDYYTQILKGDKNVLHITREYAARRLNSLLKVKKNVSTQIPNGRTAQTRDEYLGIANKNYRKPGYDNKGNYRKIVVVDSNRKNELAVVKLTTSSSGESLPNYKNGKSKFRPFVETKDNKGNPIKIDGKKFVENSSNADVPEIDLKNIKRISFRQSKQARRNKKLVRQLKGRK